MVHASGKTTPSGEGKGGSRGRTRTRWLAVTVPLGAFMVVAAVAWACTPNQMNGHLWFSGSTGVNVLNDDPGTVVSESNVASGSKELGSCPGSPPHKPSDRESAFNTGDVVCVQAKGLDDVKRFYELKYAPTTTQTNDDQEATACLNSRKTLPNLSTDHGLYEPWRGANGSTQAWFGWEDQQTVLDMPGGTYTVCAASVTPPAAGVMTEHVNVQGPGKYDNGPEDDGSHLLITVTGPAG